MGSGILLLIIFTSVGFLSPGSVALCSVPYCPPPWTTFQKHCYMLVDQKMPWLDAEHYCQMLSRPGKMVHLASIHSAEENSFISEYVKKVPTSSGSFWIGYNDRQREKHFKWTDGSNVTYDNWNAGEPNNIRDEDCVEKYYSKQTWNDRRCSKQLTFVCKI